MNPVKGHGPHGVSKPGSKNGVHSAAKGRDPGGALRPKRQVLLYPSRKFVDVAPGVKTAPLPRDKVPEYGVCKLRACGDGTYQPILRVLEPYIRVSEAAKLLDVPYSTLRRLCRAGFVESTQISPNNFQVNLASWFEHIDRVRKDPEFWLREENMRRYREAL